MGVLIGSAVVPIACCLSWSKCTATAAISGAWGGLAASVTCWLVYTKCVYGEITLATTGDVSIPSYAHPLYTPTSHDFHPSLLVLLLLIEIEESSLHRVGIVAAGSGSLR